jgi:N-acetyl-gamma-glutamyl-phosphate reductase
MKSKIYVDGQDGTTGLKIHEHLAGRGDLDVLRIEEAKRKDVGERKRLLNAADVAFLCLPEAASREAVGLVENEKTKVIDASTAFRVDPSWVYGLPELSPAHREKLRHARRIANPGCHATAFILSVYPLVAAGVVSKDAQLTCVSLTGYSGGGKKMIAAYEAKDRSEKLASPRPYALGLAHKHVPEMTAISGLTRPPIFTPVVCDIYNGLAVEIFLPASTLSKRTDAAAIHAVLAAHYAGEKFVRVMPFDPSATGKDLDEGTLDIRACNETNRADIFVFGHDDQIAVITRLDNLGKGASGAAVQCMNLAIGAPEDTGLSA